MAHLPTVLRHVNAILIQCCSQLCMVSVANMITSRRVGAVVLITRVMHYYQELYSTRNSSRDLPFFVNKIKVHL